MKNTLKSLIIIIWSLLAFGGIAYAQTTGGLTVPQGGTGMTSYTAGDLFYSATTNPIRFSRLPIGASGTCLKVSSNLPAWQACGGAGGTSGGTWSTSTSQVSGQFVNYPNNTTDIVLIGGTSTSTAPFTFDPNLKTLHLGNTINPQLDGFGTKPYEFQIDASINDVVGQSIYNRSTGSQATAGLFFQNNLSPLGGIGLAQTYYAGMAFAGSNWNGPAVGLGALPANGFVVYNTDGKLILGSATTTGEIDLYTGAGSFAGGIPDMALNSAGNVSIGVATTTGYRLEVGGLGRFTGLVDAPNFVATSTSVASTFAYNVGIGTTSPTNKLDIAAGGNSTTALVVHGTTVNATLSAQQLGLNLNYGATTPYSLNSSAGNLNIQSSSADINFLPAQVQQMVIKAGGNVGIGDTTPYSKLVVSGTAVNSPLTGLSIVNNTPYGVGTGAPTARMTFNHNNGTGAATGEQAYIEGGNSGETSSINGYLALGTRRSDTLTEAMRILSGGNVGIGTTTPISKLNVQTGTTLDGIFLTDAAGLNRAALVNNASIGANLLLYNAAGTSQDVQFSSRSGTANYINNGGNFGIGSTTPNTKLTVVGNGRFSGLTANGGIYGDNGGTVDVFSLTRQDTVTTGDLSLSAYGGIGLTGGKQSNTPAASGYGLYVNSTNNVGIGTTTPTYNLDVSSGSSLTTAKFSNTSSGSGTFVDIQNYGNSNSQLRFISGSGTTGYTTGYDSSTGNYSISNGVTILSSAGSSRYFNITSAGNIGIGTTSPTRTLTVASAATSQVGIDTTSTGASGRVTFTENSNLMGAIQMLGSAFATTNRQNALEIFNSANGPVNIATNGTERMRIDSTGNVGIGTTSPDSTLYVLGLTTSNGLAMKDFTAPTSAQTYSITAQPIYAAAGNTRTTTSEIDLMRTSTVDGQYSGEIAFNTRLTGNALAEVMRLSSTGNVGIGTTSPQTKLEVYGTASSTVISASDLSATSTLSGPVLIGDPATIPITQQFAIKNTTNRTNILNAFSNSGTSVFSITNGGVATAFSGYSAASASGYVCTISCTFGVTSTGAGANTTVTGSAAVSGILKLKSTSGIGTSDFISMLVGNNGATEAMRIITSGFVGIGTTTPQTKLTVVGTSGPGSADFYSSSGGASNAVNIGVSALTPYIQGTTAYGNLTSTLVFNPSGGSVGIGTSTPVANLQVTAAVNATTTLEVGRGGSNKGSCVKLYDATGVAWYYTPAVGTGALTLASATSCASVSGF